MYIIPVDFRNPQFPLIGFVFLYMMSPENIILEQAMNILQELLYIWSDWKSFNGLNFLEDIDIKFREMSW